MSIFDQKRKRSFSITLSFFQTCLASLGRLHSLDSIFCFSNKKASPRKVKKPALLFFYQYNDLSATLLNF
jgi:hypothetical protein